MNEEIKNMDDLNGIINLLYRTLEKETVAQLETGIDPVVDPKMRLKLQFEPIDFSEHVHHDVHKQHFYLIRMGDRRFCITKNSTSQCYMIHNAYEPEGRLPGRELFKIGFKFVSDLKYKLGKPIPQGPPPDICGTGAQVGHRSDKTVLTLI